MVLLLYCSSSIIDIQIRGWIGWLQQALLLTLLYFSAGTTLFYFTDKHFRFVARKIFNKMRSGFI